MDLMEVDDKGVHSRKEFNQLYAILKFFSEPIRYPPDAKMQDNISYEMFINICYHLPPRDLLMLACVCKHFKNMLDGNILPISWDIWKTSRERFTPFKDMDPPKGLNEHKFARLLNFENGCEFCKHKDKRIQIYWVACVRSCKECLHKRAKSRQELEVRWKIESEIFTGTPHILPCPDDDGITQYYWGPHITSSQNEFLGVNILKRGEWTAKKKHEIQSVIGESLERYHWVTRCWQEQLKEQKDHLQIALLKFYDQFTSYTPELLMKHVSILTTSANIEMNPFIQQDWDTFQSDLIETLKSKPISINNPPASPTQAFNPKFTRKSEPKKFRPENEQLSSKRDFYGLSKQQRLKSNNINNIPNVLPDPNATSSTQIVRSIPNSTPITPIWANVLSSPPRNNQLVRYTTPQNRPVLNRRNEIVKHLKLVAVGAKQRNKKTTKAIPYTIDIHDSLFKFLPLCSTFINPPEPKDYSGYYKKEFVYNTIIPNLQREAVLLSVSKRVEGTQYHILDVQGAISHHLDEHPVFKCKLCPDCNPSVMRKMKNHLRDVHHITEKDLSKLCVDPDAVINFLHFAFVPEINYLR